MFHNFLFDCVVIHYKLFFTVGHPLQRGLWVQPGPIGFFIVFGLYWQVLTVQVATEQGFPRSCELFVQAITILLPKHKSMYTWACNDNDCQFDFIKNRNRYSSTAAAQR